MKVGQKVWTSTVFSHGHDSPMVYLAERTVVAVTDVGIVVEAKNHPTVVEIEDNLHPTKAEAAEAAIKTLVEKRDAVASRFEAEIDKLKKISLRDAAVSV